MENNTLKFAPFLWRVTALHCITYFVMGFLAALLLDYKTVFDSPPMSYYMRSIDSPWVSLGPSLQVFRGIIFSLSLWFFKDIFLFVPYGWLKLWGLLLGLCILSTSGAAPGSIEGFIYTKVPLSVHLKGYLEIVPQTFLFSVGLREWYAHPKKTWNVLSFIVLLFIFLMSFMGVLAATGHLTS